MPPRLTFSKETVAPLSSEAMALDNGVLVRAGVRQRADQHVAADSRKCVQIASKWHLSYGGTRLG